MLQGDALCSSGAVAANIPPAYKGYDPSVCAISLPITGYQTDRRQTDRWYRAVPKFPAAEVAQDGPRKPKRGHMHDIFYQPR